MQNRLLALICALLICIYFLAFTAQGLRTGLNSDDVVNLNAYEFQPAAALVKANIFYFSPSYRPLGALFYRPLFVRFGFWPVPYRVICFLILLANLWLAYLAIRLLTGSREIAALSTLIGSFHPRFAALYMSSGSIYDLLCFTFYFAAWAYYLHARQNGPVRAFRHFAVFLILYISALDAKEMAVTLPALLILTELLYSPPPAWRILQGIRWVLSQCRLALVAGIATIPYVWGKLLPESPFHQLPSYHPEISLRQFLMNYGVYLDNLFYRTNWFSAERTAVFLAATLLAALFLRSRHLLLAWSMAVISFLPIAFIASRAAYAFYIPFVAWALFAAALLCSLRNRLISSRKSIGPVELRQLALVFLTFLLLIRAHRIQRLHMGGATELGQPLIESIVTQLDRLKPDVPRGVRTLAVNDPYPRDQFGLILLLRLYFRDGALEVDHADLDDCRHAYVLLWCGKTLVISEHPSGFVTLCQAAKCN